MKNKYFFVLGLLIFLGTVQTVAGFYDVDQNTKYSNAINFIASQNIVSGYPDGSFRPFQILNRAELLKIVVEAVYGETNTNEISSYSNQKCFKDIPAEQWFTKYVCFAKAKNIVSGYPDGTFKPEQNIIFVEALKITMNGFRFKSLASEPWYRGFIDEASSHNFIPLDVITFEQGFNRGQMAELITRILKFQDAELNTYLGQKTNIVVTFDTIKQGLYMENSYSSDPEPSPLPTPNPTPSPNPTPTPLPFTPKYGYTNYDYTGSSTDAYLGIGETLRVSDDINIRIDSIEPNAVYNVQYSIWGKTNTKSCSLISSTGKFSSSDNMYKFREFTDSFLELIEVSNMKAHIRLYYGQQAKNRCDQTAGWKKDIACSFYPRNDYGYIAAGKFKTFFDVAADQEISEYYLDAFNNCYNLYTQKIPKLTNILPFNSFWKLYFGPTGGYSTDYERVTIPPFNESISGNISLYEDAVKNGKCPMIEIAIPHELTHALFATTPLQDVYDAGVKNEVSGLPGIADLAEGFAEYMPYFTTKNSGNYDNYAKTYYDLKMQRCGKDSLLDVEGNIRFSGGTDTQKKYSVILAGQGYNGFSRYDMGFCFYKRVEDTCGDGAILGMINKAIDEAGSLAAHPTMFKYLANSCGEDKIKSIMQDFGFDEQLLNVSQQNPNQGFPNNLNGYACMQ